MNTEGTLLSFFWQFSPSTRKKKYFKNKIVKMCASTSSLDDLENMIKTAKENENA
jgi:hypothetical protein